MSYADKARAVTNNVARLEHLEPCAQCSGVEAHRDDCPQMRPAPPLASTLTLDQVKELHVRQVLREKNWHRTNAAKALGIDRRTLYHLIERYEIKLP